jgi:cell division transport system permease protein
VIRAGARCLYFARTSLRGIAATPGTAIVATATITVALVLVGAFGLVVLNMQALLARVGDAVQVTAFLAEVCPRPTAPARAKIGAISGVARAELISEAAALERFKGGVGQGFALVEGLGSNPLPASIEITLETRYRTPAISRASRRRWRACPASPTSPRAPTGSRATCARSRSCAGSRSGSA